MSYLVLARKYRPQVFEDIVGQEHVSRTLANAISGGRVAHAYLFCGPRGVGKTTAARILAKALNCEKGPAPVPCNECGPCREVTGGRSLDVLEIDGASNRGINEVRELRENTRYAAAGGRFKVYIIDEVHMLTNEAFNALLKTLEEPPAHVVFVLATTEPFKVPPTILSRCQRFDFARIPGRKIAEHLTSLLEKEGTKASPEAIALIARRARGGLRDALSLTDQILSAVEGDLDREAVERILGLVGFDFFHTLVDRVADEDAGAALTLLHETYERGADLGEVAEGLAAHLRDLLFLRLDEGLAGLLEAPESEGARLEEQANRFPPEVLRELLDRAAQAAVELRRSDHPLLVLELLLAEMCLAAGRVPLADLAERLLALEARLGGGAGPGDGGGGGGSSAGGRSPAAPAGRKGKPSRSAAPPRPDPPGAANAGSGGPAAARAEPEPAAATDPARELWASCLESLRERSMRLWGTFHGAEAVGFAADGAMILRGGGTESLLRAALEEPRTRSLLREVLAAVGAEAGGVCLEADAAVAEPEPPAAAGESAASPAGSASGAGEDPASEEAPSDDRSMGRIFKEEPMLQKALDMFEGEVLP